MTETDFDTNAYLQRIGYDDDVKASLEILRKLHRHQLYSIPFENFDICLGRTVDLDPDYQFDKLVLNRRGGYCFELNGLFLRALISLGFDARPLLARVHGADYVGGRDHQLTLVTIGGEQWIADVGFGRDTPRSLLPLNPGSVVDFEDQNLRLVDGERWGTLLQQKHHESWENMFTFDLQHVGPADIQQSNHFTSTHPSSHFVRRRVAALPIDGGTATLSNYQLTIRQNGHKTELQLPDNQDYLKAIEKHFGIELKAHYQDLRPVSAG